MRGFNFFCIHVYLFSRVRNKKGMSHEYTLYVPDRVIQLRSNHFPIFSWRCPTYIVHDRAHCNKWGNSRGAINLNYIVPTCMSWLLRDIIFLLQYHPWSESITSSYEINNRILSKDALKSHLALSAKRRKWIIHVLGSELDFIYLNLLCK